MADAKHLSHAIVAFALDGQFPDDITALPPISQTDLAPAIASLDESRAKLEAEIHAINEETRGEVSSWERNAKSLQDDIIRSKAIANDIIRQSEAPETSGEAIQAAEERAEFLAREAQYSQQLHGVIKGIHHVNGLLDSVETASKEHRILDSLRLLEKSWDAIDHLGVSKSCRVMRLLDIRSFELKSDVHAVFDRLWKDLIEVDMGAGQVAIHDAAGDDQMTLADAVIGFKAYKEVDERMEQLWRNIDAAIVTPRMDAKAKSLPKFQTSGDAIGLDGRADGSIRSLLADLEKMLALLAAKLPSDLIPPLCGYMMADVVPRLIRDWLSPAVPTSLENMAGFEETMEDSKQFCASLEQHGYTGFEELQDWVENAPTVWLNKCRETALDTIRTRLANGIGKSRPVEKIEKQMVSLPEGKELATSGAGAAADTNDWGDDWGEAWDEDGEADVSVESNGKAAGAQPEDDGTDAWGWEEEEAAGETKPPSGKADDDEDESADAWGWGDDIGTQEPASAPAATDAGKSTKPKSTATAAAAQSTRELILKETYHISSMPDPVLDLISSILDDGARLAKGGDEFAHVSSMAPGLFDLPTSALALFRAISPHYYSLDGGGNMFLYNDAMYLAERLSTLSEEWRQRSDVTPPVKGMLRLEADAKSLQSFANRSYTDEMNVQKTVLRDLVGGSQGLAGQDEWESAIESGTARVRTMAATWEPILARSVWSQAVGSLADALAMKLITDVLEMSSIGQDEAYSIAKVMAAATELDDLFLPSKLSGAGAGTGAATAAEGDEMPATAQYAPNWLRLKYLSEVLQSNLNEVKFLWLDSELSLYFTVNEVTDLIEASFENNSRTREAIREIQARPNPLA
ncbi:protein transport protein DSL1/ZW10 [Geosmithia morbida]|uniref:Protein transport protein DSL1/ZW10 n=1 Tax=Geosmithia morbida TaxID=1094350 RepID=A0A9P4YTF4_9HYPO|nr:protein transport protein DSL1/ZW10 [Geosmithia morbida]KAF4120689.1 protein transport protein DSL1/ZW10 [Geosmithia morbida]